MNQIYAQLNVLPLANKLVDTLSGGERKRLGLGAALVRKPDVILLDEPTNHMYVCMYVRARETKGYI